MTVAIASINTRPFTELAIRTAVRRAGRDVRVVVGDAGSTDGTLEMLKRLGPEYVTDIEVEPAGRKHAEWMDGWLRSIRSEFVVFVDSDLEFRRSGWLTRMLDVQQREGADIVAGEWQGGASDYIEPVGLRSIRAMPRPAPWLLLVKREPIQALETSFEFFSEETDEVHEGIRAWDVAGRIAYRARGAGLKVSIMPDDFRKYYHHYEGRSWRRSGRSAIRANIVGSSRLVRFRLLGR